MRTAQMFGKPKRGTSSQLPNGSLKRKEVEARRECKCGANKKDLETRRVQMWRQ